MDSEIVFMRSLPGYLRLRVDEIKLISLVCVRNSLHRLEEIMALLDLEYEVGIMIAYKFNSRGFEGSREA